MAVDAPRFGVWAAQPGHGILNLMSEAARKTFLEALSLSPSERLELAAELIDSVEGASDPQWEEAWKAELDARMRAAEGRAERGSSWIEARKRIVSRLSDK